MPYILYILLFSYHGILASDVKDDEAYDEFPVSWNEDDLQKIMKIENSFENVDNGGFVVSDDSDDYGGGFDEEELKEVDAIMRELEQKDALRKSADITLPQSDPDKSSPYVIVDLETTGLDTSTTEICQIAAKYGKEEFNNYILPLGKIPAVVTAITNITVEDGVMYVDGNEVKTTPLRSALSNFIEFLRRLGPKVNLVAHNGWWFDFPIILHHMIKANLLADFVAVTHGFTDTLPMFRWKFPDRVTDRKRFSQGALAADFNVSVVHAHNALGDVRMLQGLLNATEVTTEDLYLHTKPVSVIMQNLAARFDK